MFVQFLCTKSDQKLQNTALARTTWLNSLVSFSHSETRAMSDKELPCRKMRPCSTKNSDASQPGSGRAPADFVAMEELYNFFVECSLDFKLF